MDSMERKSIFFPRPLWRKILREAKRNHVSAAAWVRMVTSREIEKKQSNSSGKR